jgi:Short C-terminal domain
MPPLVRPVGPVRAAARTGVVAGTATAVGTGVAHHQQEKDAREAAEAAERDARLVAYAAEPPPIENDYITELQKLAERRASGVITEAEFEAKKTPILGI